MFTGYQVLMLALDFVMTIVAVWGVVAKSQAALKSEVNAALADLKKAHDEALAEMRKQGQSTNESFSKIGLQINTILEGDVRELREQVRRLETGQDEWTKTLRQRTHDLADEQNKMRLEFELLKVGKVHGKAQA